MASLQISVLLVEEISEAAGERLAALKTAGLTCTSAGSAPEAAEALRHGDFQLVLAGAPDPIETLKITRSLDEEVAVVLMIPTPTAAQAIDALKQGAQDLMIGEPSPEAVVSTVRVQLARRGVMLEDPEAALHRTIGRQVRQVRERQGMTLRQLARRTGLSISMVSQLERAETAPSLVSLYRVARALRVRLAELVSAV